VRHHCDAGSFTPQRRRTQIPSIDARDDDFRFKFQTAKIIDLHVIASRRVGAKRRQDTVSRSRGRMRPRFARDFLTLRSEGAGNAGRPMRPIAACAMSVIERTRVSQVTPESPGIPRAMVYGLYRALPGDRAFLPPSPALLSANLMPASGHQDHTSSPSASSAVRYRRIRVHRIPPRGRDDRVSPLCGTGRRGI
jgi:hypothetical protein